MTWAILALLVSVEEALLSELNRFFKQDGLRLNFWRLTAASILMLPFMPFVTWPHSTAFYLTACLSGLSLAVGKSIVFNLSAKHNGRVATVYLPITAVFSYIFWLVIKPEALTHQLENIPQTLGIITCFAIIVIAMLFVRKNDVGKKILLIMIPLGIWYAFVTVAVKYSLDGISILASMPVYVFVTYLNAILVSGIFIMFKRNKNKFFDSQMIKPAIIMGLVGTVGWFLYFAALVKAPNPAYITILAMLTPIWLLIFHRLTGVKDNASPLAGTIMVLAAIALIIITKL